MTHASYVIYLTLLIWVKDESVLKNKDESVFKNKDESVLKNIKPLFKTT